MRVALVTNCTNRKALAPSVAARAIRGRTLSTFLTEWRAKISCAPAEMHARDLYLGRGFQEAKRAWAHAQDFGEADLLIASAGLGIITANDKVPSYSITVSGQGEDSVVSRLAIADATDWWTGLTARRRGLLARCAEADLIVVALSAPYLHMMRQELAAIAASTPQRLRIVARNDPGAELPELSRFWIRYDTRLNGAKSPYAGAESDFAQRALRHFVEHILAKSPRGSFSAHAESVARAQAGMSRPRRVKRARLDDAEIVRLMRKIGISVGAGRMLRILRDEHNVACEQTRCSTLFKKAFGEDKPRDKEGPKRNRGSR
jgi:hypothetical protein